ncbi:biotin transporter BioY [bacterium]|nr:biotin transporter BioY [bacterium]
MKKALVAHLTLENNASLLKQFTLIVCFSLLTAAGAWVTLPLSFSPVPITLQTLVVSLAGAVLGAKRGALSQLMYIGYGICGLPVFAGGLTSIAVVLGPSGGYLIGFPVAAFLTGLLVSDNKNILWNLGALIIGSLPVLLLGTLQLSLFTAGNLREAFAIGFVPFIAGDFIKCALAALILSGKQKLMQ